MVPLVQMHLLAQRPDMEEWVNILFVVVLAVLYLVGALVKTVSQKGQSQQQGRRGAAKEQAGGRENWQKRLARKAEEMQRAVVERARQMEQQPRPREQAGRPRPAGKITIRPGQGGESIMVYERVEQGTPAEQPRPAQTPEPRQTPAAPPKYVAPAPPPFAPATEIGERPLEPLVEDLADITLEPPKPLKLREQQWETPGRATGFHPSGIIDYSDPDALKKAILHCEILGKPVALRDPSEQVASF